MSSEEKRALLPAALPSVAADHWRAGHSIIPMGADKVPLVRWKRYEEQSPSAGDLRYWCEEFGDRIRGWARVTGAVGGVIVLDFDGAEGVAWCEAWNLSAHVRTGSGGRHWIGKHPGWRVKTLNGKSAKELGKRWPGVDIRGDGGYSLICGYGDRYTWLRDPAPDDLSVLPREIAEFFGLLAAPVLTPSQTVRSAKPRDVTRVTNGNSGGARPTPEQLFANTAERWRGSGRNDIGFQLAIQFRDNGYSQHEAEAFAYWQYCGPTNTKGEVVPYDASDWSKTVRSAYSRSARDPWASPSEKPPPHTRAPAEAHAPAHTGEAHASAPAPAEAHARMPAPASPTPAPAPAPAPAGFAGARASGNGSRPPLGSLLTDAQLTDLGNAYRLVERHGENLRYLAVWQDWLQWDGARWAKDRSLRAHGLAQETIEALYLAAYKHPDEDRRKKLSAFALKSQSHNAVAAALAEARSFAQIAALPEQFDTHPELLCCPNGTVSLETGQLRPSRREDHLTQLCPVPYDPDATCPRWDQFLSEVMDGNEELIAYVWQAIGYTLTGWDDERCLFLLCGVGRTGKSTFLETLAALMGDYSHKLKRDALMARRGGPGQATPEVAGLRGRRYAYITETKEGDRLDEGLVKELTGREHITARLLYGQEFTFRPTHKLWLATNHEPRIVETDDAIWDRQRLIPWRVRFGGDGGRPMDASLPGKLIEELPGILAHAVRAAVTWRREGLSEPPAVIEATAAYRRQMDTTQAMVDECCDVGAGLTCRSGVVYQRLKRWCEENNEFCPSQRKLARQLEEKGFVQEQGAGGFYYWRGLDVKEDERPWMPREG